MQQYRALQTKHLDKNNLTVPQPHRQFILDLQAWLQNLQSQGHQIILNLDNNEDLYHLDGSIHPLPYNPDLSTSDKLHNGSLSTLIMTCGLIDILAIQHSSRPFPPTYIRGRKRINYMLISASLQNTVECSGILPYGSLFAGDHHPCFLDFDANLLFAGPTSPLAPACQCSLQLTDPRQINLYKAKLHEQLEYHKVLDKCKDLYDIAVKGQWNEEYTQQYENLDLIITQSMLLAEQFCGKCYTKRFDWSPQVMKAVESV